MKSNRIEEKRVSESGIVRRGTLRLIETKKSIVVHGNVDEERGTNSVLEEKKNGIWFRDH